MRIQSNGETSPVVRPADRHTVQAQRLGQDDISLKSSNDLERALENTEAVRPSKVAAARELVADKTYPPEVMVRKIAELLAIHIGSAQSNDEAAQA